MTDHEVTPPDDQRQQDRGVPLFWGVLVMALVTAVAVWLFSQIDLGGDPVGTTLTGARIDPHMLGL